MSRRGKIGLGMGLLAVLGLALSAGWDDLFEKRVRIVVPGRIVRGAWQRPGPLGRIIAREKIRTIVTLTAINRDDPKYVAQAEVVRRTGVDWIIVPMRGSSATPEQMAAAADLLADPRRQPVFFHCVAGHHRTSLTHAAYRVRHEGWSAERAWREVAGLPWARADRADHELILAFAKSERDRSRKDDDHGQGPASAEVGRADVPGAGAPRAGIHRLEPVHGQLRDGRDAPALPLGTDVGRLAGPGRS